FSGKNLFLDMVEQINRELTVSDCWVCGGTGTSEVWPWEGISLSPQEILKLKDKNRMRRDTPHSRDAEEIWRFKSKTIGEECLWRRRPRYDSVGKMSCKRYFVSNGTHHWWIPKAPDLYWSSGKREGCSY
ncbi:ENR1 protein, partial [Eulacestoma nigropectus]|nr:ENR1 protein [Eulacestoma nigropectus]